MIDRRLAVLDISKRLVKKKHDGGGGPARGILKIVSVDSRGEIRVSSIMVVAPVAVVIGGMVIHV